MTLLLVGAGGALGSIVRHVINRLIHQRALASTFPLGIFLINVTGSIVIGVIAGLLASGRLHLTFEERTFVIVGLLGGFTTFSSFSLDTLTLIQTGRTGAALVNVLGQVTLSLLGVWAGFRLSGG
jgi:CrcB protein